MVLDGGYRFTATNDGGTTDFTYIALLDALTAAGHQVTRAHRQSDSSAHHSNFDFSTTLDLLDFDMMWLIGLDGRNVSGSTTKLPDPELRAIARFMEAGGGVFATGDHDSIGADMCGHIPRVRAMRSWFGQGDDESPMAADFPRNFPPLGSGRADTTRRNDDGSYTPPPGAPADAEIIWFENQSDAIPQTISALTSPEFPDPHVILQDAGDTITVYPDHMHEGNTLGEVTGYPYASATASFSGETFTEFPEVDGHREMPRVIAQGSTTAFSSYYAHDGTPVDPAVPSPKTVNTLSVYDGRTVGVGRVVTGSTFHHYVDINLTGDSRIDEDNDDLTGEDAAKGHGFNDDVAVFDQIRTVYQNITAWLARPRPRITLILERSTFSQAEADADPVFDGAILVTVDGLKPSQFPGGGITSLSPSNAQLAAWAPALSQPAGITITPRDISSDDPGLNDRLQRITFTYRIEISAAAFGFGGDFQHVSLTAALNSPAAGSPLTDAAQITLVKSANPFMLDLDNGNDKPWLSTDVRVFPVVAGAPGSPLPADATRAQALSYLTTLIDGMTETEFEALETGQSASALSPLPTTTGTPALRIYNFGIARVRVPASGSAANDVRVFFRIFTSQTTAALTYRESPPGTPIEGYPKTTGGTPIALPGTNAAGTEWLSFPMFAAARAGTPGGQADPANLHPGIAPGTSGFFGCLIDNNLSGNYLPSTPTAAGATDLPNLLMSEHQCMVAQIEFAGTPIPNGANPFTSDKLSQRNIALSTIANPGVDASRWAIHTFELEASPNGQGSELPDELLIDWSPGVPDNTELRLHIPGWQAAEVIALADRVYPRHDLRAVDEHTVALPAGGTRYVPLPPSSGRRTGVAIIAFPLGVKAGQRFDMSVRQVTNRGRRDDRDRADVRPIDLREARRLIAGLRQGDNAVLDDDGELPIGVFDLGDNRTLVTDLSVINAQGDMALLVQHVDPEVLRRQSGPDRRWREVIGAFQIGVPVSVRDDMLDYHLRLLSIMRYRLELLRPVNRWYPAFSAYVELLTRKVAALGGNPATVRPTPDGEIDLPGGDDTGGGGDPGGPGDPPLPGDPDDGVLEPGDDGWLEDTKGLPDPETAGIRVLSGKVSGLIYDHFGDFEGLTLESYAGTHHRFYSREAAIEDLARTAWIERYIVTVMTVGKGSREIRRLLFRGV